MAIKKTVFLLVSVLVAMSGCSLAPDASKPQIILEQDYPVQPVPFTAVHLDDAFWAPRIEINRTVTIPYAFQKCEETGRIDNFVRAAQALHDDPALEDREVRGFPFDDTDVYKVIEGASFGLSVHPDPAMDQYLDGVIAKIAAAQEPDGYLYTARTINPEHPHEWAGPERWVNVSKGSHELYNMGHLYEAAVAHYQATGKRTLLDVALKNADLLCTVFGPGKNESYPGHQIVEMGLVKLYRVTGRKKYLDLAKFFLDTRGPGGDPYNQADKKVVDQSEAVGHAVRATYMYSGMADVAALTGNRGYIDALNRIWGDVVGKKLYVTGGIGALHEGEAFGPAYELPNMSAYCETCAAVGNVFWNERLFLLEPDAKYVDTLEQTLYNGLISGVSLDGKSFFYPNPLESKGDYVRSPWFGCACCPGNITRFVASVPGYQYGVRDQSVYINLYASGTGNLTVKDQPVRIRQETRYPWDGKVKLTVEPGQTRELSIRLRIPGWARNEANPDGLYHFLQTVDAPPSITVNGEPVEAPLEKGYAVIDRSWNDGDTIDLDLPMPVRRVIADDQVEADRGRVALQRGPIVFCLEGPDNVDGHVRNLAIDDGSALETAFNPDLLGGVETISGEATAVSEKGKKHSQNFVAIPYYAWANRGGAEMIVWVARDAEHAKVGE